MEIEEVPGYSLHALVQILASIPAFSILTVLWVREILLLWLLWDLLSRLSFYSCSFQVPATA